MRPTRGLLLLCAVFLAASALSRNVHADDPIPLDALTPEMLEALRGSIPPEMMAALTTAMNRQHATHASAPSPDAGMPLTLPSLDEIDAQPRGSHVVDVHPDDVVEPHAGPERIRPGHATGMVELHHDEVAPSTPEPTTLPTVRVAGHGHRTTTAHARRSTAVRPTR